MKYGGKELSSYTVSELGDILNTLTEAEKKREEASKHHKFDKVNNNKALDFPPINPKFLELKAEVEKVIKDKQGLKEVYRD